MGEWALQPVKWGEQVDLIFSCMALRWIENQATVFPRLLEKLASGGVLAVNGIVEWCRSTGLRRYLDWIEVDDVSASALVRHS